MGGSNGVLLCLMMAINGHLWLIYGKYMDNLWLMVNGYPLVICYIAIENGHRNSEFSH